MRRVYVAFVTVMLIALVWQPPAAVATIDAIVAGAHRIPRSSISPMYVRVPGTHDLTMNVWRMSSHSADTRAWRLYANNRVCGSLEFRVIRGAGRLVSYYLSWIGPNDVSETMMSRTSVLTDESRPYAGVFFRPDSDVVIQTYNQSSGSYPSNVWTAASLSWGGSGGVYAIPKYNGLDLINANGTTVRSWSAQRTGCA